jgi:hypothetical protein
LVRYGTVSGNRAFRLPYLLTHVAPTGSGSAARARQQSAISRLSSEWRRKESVRLD